MYEHLFIKLSCILVKIKIIVLTILKKRRKNVFNVFFYKKLNFKIIPSIANGDISI